MPGGDVATSTINESTFSNVVPMRDTSTDASSGNDRDDPDFEDDNNDDQQTVSSYLVIKVQTSAEDPHKAFFRLNPRATMWKIFSAYESTKGSTQGAYKYLFNGKVIDGDITPIELGLKMDDSIDAVVANPPVGPTPSEPSRNKWMEIAERALKERSAVQATAATDPSSVQARMGTITAAIDASAASICSQLSESGFFQVKHAPGTLQQKGVVFFFKKRCLNLNMKAAR
jgi:hypothetical protein